MAHYGDPPRVLDEGGGERGALADGHQPSDVGNADRFVAHADGRARWVPAWNKWCVYRDGRWVHDHGAAEATELAIGIARKLRHRAADTHGDAREALWDHAKRLEKATTIASMLHLSRGKPGVLTDHELFDVDPLLFNVRNGTVDLRTGKLRPHNPDDLLAMQAPVTYDPHAKAPMWEECLATWQPDPDARRFLQVVAGTAVTGFPLDKVLVNVGHGANGKSVFFGVLRRLLGEYATEAHKSLIVDERHEQHETVVADLYRRRLVLAPETSQTDKLSEDQIKNLTGNDRLKARRMREDRWYFDPTHTLVMHTNFRPRIVGTDEGIWRRVLLLDWPTTIARATRDPDLAAKLELEHAGILRWLIDGALAYLAAGRVLELPASVAAATDEYRLSEDQVGRFIAERCELEGDALLRLPKRVAAGDLLDAYLKWCSEGGEHAMSQTAFGRELTARGFPTEQSSGGKRWRRGLELAADLTP